MVTKSHIEKLKTESNLNPSIIERAGIESFNRNKGYPNGIAFPYFDLNGHCLGHRVKQDVPIQDESTGKTIKYFQPKESSINTYFLKEEINLILDDTKPLLITEGEKKLLALIQTNPIQDVAHLSFSGCWNHSHPDDKKELPEIWNTIPLNGRSVYLLPDTDFFFNSHVQAGYESLIQKLVKRGAEVKLVDLRIKNCSDKIGIDDFLIKNSNDILIKRLSKPVWIFGKNTLYSSNPDEIRTVAKRSIFSESLDKEAEVKAIKDVSKLSIKLIRDEFQLAKKEYKRLFVKEQSSQVTLHPIIQYNPLIDSPEEVCKKIGAELSKNNHIFIQKDGTTLYFFSEDFKSFQIPSNVKDVQGVLSKYLSLQSITTKKDDEEALGAIHQPSYDILNQFMANLKSYGNFRELSFVSTLPIITKNSMISTFGYHEQDRVFYNGETLTPSTELNHIPKLLSLSAYKSDIDRTNSLGAMLGCLMLNSFIGTHPALLIIGDSINTGKTIQAQMFASLISEKPTRINALTSEEELPKVLASLSIENYLILDNIKVKEFSSQFLEQILTSPVISIRLLGTNKMMERDNNIQFIFTINSPSIGPDLGTRTVPIELTKASYDLLDKKIDPLKYFNLHKNEIIGELLFLYQNYINLGSPKHQIKYKRYPEWALEINSILATNGYHGFLQNVDKIIYVTDRFTKLTLQKIIQLHSQQKLPSKISSSEILQYLEAISHSDFEYRQFNLNPTKIGKFLSNLSEKGKIEVSYENENYSIEVFKFQDSRGGSNSNYSISVTSVTNSQPSLEAKNNDTDGGSVFNPREIGIEYTHGSHGPSKSDS